MSSFIMNAVTMVGVSVVYETETTYLCTDNIGYGTVDAVVMLEEVGLLLYVYKVYATISGWHVLSALRHCLLLLVASVCLASCTQDNVHMPEGVADAEEWRTYTQSVSGVLVTTVPAMQEYLQGPVESAMTVSVEEFNVAHSGYVTVSLQAFAIDDPFVVDLFGKGIEIGSMSIPEVEYAAFPSGGGYLRKDAFDVMAGEYQTRGSLQGEVSSEGIVSLVLTYRPGTMPFEIRSEFRVSIQ